MTYPLARRRSTARTRCRSHADNYIGINDPPDEMFGKTMSIPDKAFAAVVEDTLSSSSKEKACRLAGQTILHGEP